MFSLLRKDFCTYNKETNNIINATQVHNNVFHKLSHHNVTKILFEATVVSYNEEKKVVCYYHSLVQESQFNSIYLQFYKLRSVL